MRLKNKKGILPILMIILILVGIIVAYFILKVVLNLVISLVMWTITLSVILFGIFILYKLIMWIFPKKRGRKKRR